MQQFKKTPEDDQNLKFEYLRDLNYTHAFIKETIRSFTVVGSLIPRLTTQKLDFNGILLPKESQIMIFP